jgi:hypothetical protein
MFLSELIVQADRRPEFWILRAPLIWAGEKETVTVPEGFVTDLASVPRMAQGMPGFEPTGLSRRPAVLHDWLYSSGELRRMEADAVFYRALRREGAHEATARIYYRAVRVFGGSAWRAYRSR